MTPRAAIRLFSPGGESSPEATRPAAATRLRPPVPGVCCSHQFPACAAAASFQRGHSLVAEAVQALATRSQRWQTSCFQDCPELTQHLLHCSDSKLTWLVRGRLRCCNCSTGFLS